MLSDTHPVNVLKFCPKCGSNQFISDYNRSFKCNACKFNYYVNSSAAVAVLLYNENNELLFTRRAIEPHYGKLDLPGGFVDPMESAENAAIREIKEELKIDIHSLEYLGSYPNEYIFSGFSVFTLDMVFKANTNELDKMTANDDILSFEFHHPEKLDLNELPSISMKNIVKNIIANSNTKRNH